MKIKEYVNVSYEISKADGPRPASVDQSVWEQACVFILSANSLRLWRIRVLIKRSNNIE